MNISSMIARIRKRSTNLPLHALGVATVLTIVGLGGTMMYLFESNSTIAKLFIGLGCACALLGFTIAGNATKMAIDPRPEVSRRARGARWVSIMCVLPSIFLDGGSMALRMEDKAAQEYAGSEAYKDAKLVAGAAPGTVDSRDQAQARIDMERAIRPTQVRIDDPAYPGAILAFALLHALPLLAAAFGTLPAVETASQQARRIAEDRARRAAETRERNRLTEEQRRLAAERAASRPQNMPEFIRYVLTGSKHKPWTARAA